MTREDRKQKLEKEYLFESLCEDLKKLQTENEKLRKALDQVPCGNCISREDAIATIKNLYPDMPIMDIMGARRKWQEKYSQYIECEKEIERLPSVQTKQKTGHWIDGHCSECGCDAPAYIIDWKWQKDMEAKYCPNCGAIMEKEKKPQKPQSTIV